MPYTLSFKNPFLKTTFRFKISSRRVVTIYLCGPTVYGPLHIGNFRNVFLFDVLVRFFRRQRQPTIYWQNITDIDDKIIQAANKSKLSETTLTSKYFREYQALLKTCQLLNPDQLFVSQNIPAIIDFIQGLEKTGFTYQTQSGLYFEINRLPKYARFQTTTLPLMQRNQFWLDKKNRRDFALWKFTQTGKTWKSPWAAGRPGWHTECVALINKYNKHQPVTIHGGGRDLLFPHHENEEAQFQALHRQQLAHFWLHNGLITSQAGKISRSTQSKSEQLNMAKLLKQYDHNVFRLFFFSQPYFKDIKFSFAKMTELQKIYQRWTSLFIQIQRYAHLHHHLQWTQLVIPQTIKTKLERLLANNLGVDKLWPLFFTWEKKINTFYQRLHLLKTFKYAAYLRFGLLALGFNVPLPNWTNAQKTILARWKIATNQQNYRLADQYRKQLQAAKLWN